MVRANNDSQVRCLLLALAQMEGRGLHWCSPGSLLQGSLLPWQPAAPVRDKTIHTGSGQHTHTKLTMALFDLASPMRRRFVCGYPAALAASSACERQAQDKDAIHTLYNPHLASASLPLAAGMCARVLVCVCVCVCVCPCMCMRFRVLVRAHVLIYLCLCSLSLLRVACVYVYVPVCVRVPVSV